MNHIIDYSYQDGDVARIIEAHERVRGVLYVLPTGGGKTRVAVERIKRELAGGGTALFIAHRRELVDQAAMRLIDGGLEESAFGVIMARDARTRPDAPVQVASIDTLRRRDKPPASLIVFDEAHRSAAPTWMKMAALYPGAKRLGLTATPFRLDGKGLRDIFDEIVFGPTMEELFAFGALMPPRCWSIDTENVKQRLRSIRIERGDYDRAELSKMMNRPMLVGSCVDEYEAHGDGQRAVVFAVDLKHATALTKSFGKRGHAAAYLDSETPLAERAAILARLAKGELRVVVNCEILTEGWDCKPAKVCIMARPTRSTALCLQMVGRFLRYWRGIRPRVIDHAGNLLRHGLPQAHRDVTLNGIDRAAGPPPIRICPECDAVLLANAAECECGHVFAVASNRKSAASVDGTLRELRMTDERRAELIARLERFAHERGLGPDFMVRARASVA